MKFNDTSTTLDGIKQDIYFLAKCNANSFDAGDLNRIINKYYGQLQEVVRAVNENFYLVEATAPLTIGDGSFSLPDGVTGTAPAYEKIKSIWASYLPTDINAPRSDEYVKVGAIDPDAISDPSYTFSTDSPKALMYGNYFVLLPLVTDTTKYPVVDGVKINYIATQDKLVNDTDVPNIFPSFHDAITQGSLIDVAQRLGNDKLKADSVELFKKRLEEIKTYASSRLPVELGIVEGQEDVGGWEFPFGNDTMS